MSVNPETIIVWAEHTSKAGCMLAMTSERWDDYDPSCPDYREIEATLDEEIRHRAMGTTYGWRVSMAIRSVLGLDLEAISPDDEDSEDE